MSHVGNEGLKVGLEQVKHVENLVLVRLALPFLRDERT